jgi:hypothetical protein
MGYNKRSKGKKARKERKPTKLPTMSGHEVAQPIKNTNSFLERIKGLFSK